MAHFSLGVGVSGFCLICNLRDCVLHGLDPVAEDLRYDLSVDRDADSEYYEVSGDVKMTHWHGGETWQW